MDYEKKYNAALMWMRSVYPTLVGAAKEDAEYFFPELKGSEDEKIRKEIVVFLREGRPYHCPDSVKRQEWANWLEKQGEKPQGKSIIEAWKDMRFEVYQQASGNRHEPNCSDENTKMFSLNDIDEIIEKINEKN